MNSDYFSFYLVILLILTLPALGFLYVYSYKSRLFFLKLTGNKIIRDYGVFSEEKFFGEIQHLRLLECENKGTRFFIIEERKRLTKQGPLNIHWHKLTADGMDKMLDAIKEVKTYG